MRIKALLTSLAVIAGSAIVLAPAAHASGNSYTWTGYGDGTSWTDAGNWNPQAVPGDGDSVVFQSAVPGQTGGETCAQHVTDIPTVSLADLTVGERGHLGDPTSPCSAYFGGGTSGTVTVTDSFTWNGGRISAPLVIADGANGTVTPTIHATSEIDSNITINGTLELDNNAPADGGTHDYDQSVHFDDAYTMTVGLLGTLRTDGVNTLRSDCCDPNAHVVNNNVIDATGTLVFDGVSLDQNGTLDAENTDTQVVSVQTPNTSGNGAVYTGDGTYQVTIGDASDVLTGAQDLEPGFHFVLGGNTTVTDVQADGDETLSGKFTFAGGGEFDWKGGYLAANMTLETGTTTVANGNTAGANHDNRTIAATDSSGSSPVAAKVNNRGAMNFTGNAIATMEAGAQLYNGVDGDISLAGGTTIDTASCCTNPARIFNTGHLATVPAETGGSTPVTLDGVDLYNGGIVNIAGGAGSRTQLIGNSSSSHEQLTTAATFVVSSGELDVDSNVRQTAGVLSVKTGAKLKIGGSSHAVKLTDGTVSGNGSIYGNVVNSGADISPSGVGRLSVYGNYTAGSNSKLYFDIASSSSYDSLGVHGNVALKGTVIGHNTAKPASTWKPAVVIATGKFSGSLGCTITSGTGSTGSSARHWSPKIVSTHYLYLFSIAGQHTSC